MRKTLFLTRLILSVVVGWFFGYINFPFIDQSQSFWVGLIGGLAIMLLVMALTKSRSKMNSYGKGSSKAVFLTPLVLTVLFVSVLFLFVKNRNLESRVDALNEQTPYSGSISSSKQIEFLAIMNSLLDTVGNELKNSKNNSLSAITIGRIAAFSNTVGSYQYIVSDTGVYTKVSPVKGHLLLSLIHMNMDSSSFKQIKKQVSFAGADLSNADLSGYNLEGINLKEANLANSTLKGTNMSNSNLSGANFSQANMENANLSYSKLEKANLSWTNLSGSILYRANVETVDFRNANMNRADLREALLNESVLISAMLNKADLTGCELNRAALIGTNFTNAKLINVPIKYSTFISTNLSNTQVDSVWLDELSKWKITGHDEVVKNYHISFDSNQTCWRLIETD